MSAIWGVINLNKQPIPYSVKEIFLSAYKECVLDRTEDLLEEHYYFGCGIQYFTPEAISEQLPYKDNKSSIFTADVVLDNRDELIDKYGSIVNFSMTDGEMLFHILKSSGKECMNDILGSFSFVHYNKEMNRIDLSTDSVGARCLYYMEENHVFYFSTLLEPLVEIKKNTSLNERWLVDFLAMDHLFMINETKETPIEGIFRLAPAEYLSVSLDKKESYIYWNPFEHFSELILKNDDAYKTKFLEIWNKSVKSMIRSKDPVSILLSGGLDSTAVAAVASPFLKEQNRTLYSYTSVPAKGYCSENDDYYIDNETEDVLKTAAYYKNIETNFIDLDGKCSWELMEKEFHDIEMPFKSIQNFLWIAESCRKAYQNNSRIMLTGSYGNTSISYTDLNVYMNDLYLNHKKKFKKELKLFSETMGFPYSFAMNEIKKSITEPYKEDFHPYKHSFVNRDKANLLHSSDRISALKKDTHNAIHSYDIERMQRLNWLAMRQIGEVATKHSLYTGVLLRDPTRDRRVIEFCLRLPLSQFCKQGLDRRLVKEYMKEIIPPHIIRFSQKGKQSADLQYRFQTNWEKIRREWISIYENHNNSDLVDTHLAKQQLEEQPELTNYKSFDLVRHMYTIQVLMYEKRFSNPVPSVADNNYNENKPLISIIVPVYQVADELDKCIHSILAQNYKNLEIILVDDGSTDGSEKKCDKYQMKDSRIQVIHQKNQGVGAARNTGIKYAHGSYIGFVDGDDWIEPDMNQKLYELLITHNADISCCSFEQVLKDSTIHSNSGYFMVYYGLEMLDALVSGYDLHFFTPAIWNKLFKRELFENTYFSDYQIGEDYLFLVQILKKINKGVFLEKEYYHYIKKDNSLTMQTNNPKKIGDYIKASSEQFRELANNVSSDAIQRKYYNYFCLLLNDYCMSNQFKEPTVCRKKLKKELRKIGPQVRNQFHSNYSHGKLVHYELLLATYNPFLYKCCLHFGKTKIHKGFRKIHKKNSAKKKS